MMDFAGVDRFVVQKLQEKAPKDTGNLAFHAIRDEAVSPGVYKIYIQVEGDHRVGQKDGIAPYQVFVNENPTLRNGKENPNYHWWEKAVVAALDALADEIGGTLE